jgi:hypothetical protein
MNSLRQISLARILAVAIPILLVVLGLLWFHYKSGGKAILFQSPISTIQSVRISPGENFSLVENDVTITDAKKIREIMAAIRSAKPCSSDHPTDRWTCKLIVANSSGESSVDVSGTEGQNTILYCPGGTLQSDALGNILEKAVSKDSTVPQQQRNTVF